MAKRIKYRLNKAKRKELEALKKLSGTQEESRSLRKQIEVLRSNEHRRMREQDSVEKIKGYTVIRLGREPHYPGEIIGCSVMLRVDELVHSLMGHRGVESITHQVRQHSMMLARELENGIMAYMKQEGLL